MLDTSSQRSPAALEWQDVQVWNPYWAEVERRIGPVFACSDTRTRAMAYLAGLLSPAERKNSWQLAEISGAANPYGFQHLLGRANWDADRLRDRLRLYVSDSLADPAAVGVIDETGFFKTKASIRQAWRANIAVLPAGLRTAKSVSFWPTRLSRRTP